ncbi:hypothetical protein KW797_01110, partial [Candidatus Parcubacteria bacterium]|nr:hypothetical protein [Candidatus Parcubacteria bacterium]
GGSKTLAEIRRDAPIEFKLPERPWQESVDPSLVEALLQELEFKSLAKRVRELFGMDAPASVAEEEPGEAENEEEFGRAKIALWLINSEKTDPDREDIFEFTKVRSVKKSLPILREELARQGLMKVYEEIELPIVPMIAAAETRGIRIDRAYFKKLSADYHKALAKIEERIWKHAGGEFNINSPRQLGDILFDKLGLLAKGVRMKKTEGGARSTRLSELMKLKDLHPIIAEIVDYRELQKLLSTYIDAIPPLLDKESRLHSHFIQTGSTTGRFSSTNPNLQNIPIKSELGRNIRKGFLASDGHVLLGFDYSQIELRVAAILSEDPVLTAIFKDGRDVHAAVAARVFGVKEADVTPEMRRRAKVINFGIIYGMGVNALRENLKSTRAEAEEFYENYLKQFKRLDEYMEEVKRFVKKNGYTETLFGRRRHFPALRSGIPFMEAQALRMAINAPIQGTATADVIKLAIRFAHEDLMKEGLGGKVHLLLQIHDELIYEAEEKVAVRAEALIKRAMEEVFSRSYLKKECAVPLIANFASGTHWGEL